MTAYTSAARIVYGCVLSMAIILAFLLGLGDGPCHSSLDWSSFGTLLINLLVLSPLWLAFCGAVVWFIWRETENMLQSRRSTRLAVMLLLGIPLITFWCAASSPCVRLNS